jgi:hypothetical protein
MGTSNYLALDVALRVDAEEAETIIRQALSEMPWDPDSAGFVMTIDDDVPFLMHSGTVDDLQVDPDGLSFSDGRLQAELCITNLWSEAGSEFVDGVEIRDMRLRIDILFSAIDRIADARPGDILGAIRNEEADNLGPVFMTESGVSSSSSYSHGCGDDVAWRRMLDDPRSALRRIPVEAILGPRLSDPRERDLDRTLLKSLRPVVIDASPKTAVARTPMLG